VGGFGSNSSVSEYGTMAGSSEYKNELLDSTKSGNYVCSWATVSFTKRTVLQEDG
jgi:hypothetical protein